MVAIKREFSAGGVVFRKEPEGTLWLIIKPSGKDNWRLPKGWIEKGEKSEDAAVREVAEESGAEAIIVSKIDHEKYFFNQNGNRILKDVVFYLMEYVQESPTGFGFETQEVAWLPYNEALENLAYEGERKMLREAEKKLNQV